MGIEFKQIIDSQEYVKVADLPNGHQAFYASLEGRHTPGRNSDVLFLNKELVDNDPKASRILAMVNDGVSGDKELAEDGLGQFAAEYLSKMVPNFWLIDLQKDPVEFSRNVKLPLLEGTDAGLKLMEWMTGQVQEHRLFPPEMIKYVLKRHTDLFFNLLPSAVVERLQGRNAGEIANSILVDKAHFQELLRIILAIYLTLDSGKQEARQKLASVQGQSINPYAATTCTLLAETANDYILFAIGDSPIFALDEIGYVPHSRSEIFDKSSGPISACLGWSKSKVYVPPGAVYENGKLQKRSFISVKYISKSFLQGDLAIALMSDGFLLRRNETVKVAENLAMQIKSSRWAVAEVIAEALEKDKRYEKAHSNYEPDDKTFALIVRRTKS